MTELPDCPTGPHRIPAGWADNEPYTLKFWRNGSCTQILTYPDLQSALVMCRALVRVANTHRPTRLDWSTLGDEVKLGTEYWQENDVACYVARTRM